jgi:hypothetical protein
VRFNVKPGVPTAGRPIFRYSEYSLGFEVRLPERIGSRVALGGVASALVRTLQIDLAVKSGEALFVWGYHPQMNWREGLAVPTDPQPGAVVITMGEPFLADTGYEIPGSHSWNTVHDRTSGWLRVRADDGADDERVVLIADETCLGLIGHQLNSIWVHPTFVP